MKENIRSETKKRIPKMKNKMKKENGKQNEEWKQKTLRWKWKYENQKRKMGTKFVLNHEYFCDSYECSPETFSLKSPVFFTRNFGPCNARETRASSNYLSTPVKVGQHRKTLWQRPRKSGNTAKLIGNARESWATPQNWIDCKTGKWIRQGRDYEVVNCLKRNGPIFIK